MSPIRVVIVPKIKKAQWVKLGFSIFHFLRRSKLNLKSGVAVDPEDNRLHKRIFATDFMIINAYHINNLVE